MKQLIILFITLFLLSSYTTSSEVSEATKYKMFCRACEHSASTSQDYVVIKVKNLKTGETKEICTTPNLISGALMREPGKIREIWLDCNKYPKRYFEFRNDSALWNISFNDYSAERLVAFSKKINIDSIVRLIKRGQDISVNFGRNEKYFAHLMFNRGIITTSGCFGTSVANFKE